MYYQLADWEFCRHEEDGGPHTQSPMPRSTWAEPFRGSNPTAEFPGYSTPSKEAVAGDRNGKRWSSSRTWCCKGNVCEPESPSANCFALQCCCIFWWQVVVAAFQALLREARGCRLGCSNPPYASPASVIHINCSHSLFRRDSRSLSEGMMEISALFNSTMVKEEASKLIIMLHKSNM